MRVLIAEDDPDLARQLTKALSEAGYTVDHAPDGEEAHFLGDTEPYDAIVLDLGLPVVDGVTVLRRWREAARMEEVIARLRALIRRAAGQASPEMVCGPLRVDTRSGRAAVDGNPIKLTANEFKVLTYLMHHQGKVVSRTELTEHIYQQDFDRDSNTIEVFVGRLRKKLDLDLIQTVRGLGYRLEPPAEADG
jgi:two-component system OmpR family response regulator